MKAIYTQVSWQAGLLNKRAQQRVDTTAPRTGCAKALNVDVTGQGSIKRRPGTDFISRQDGGLRLTLYPYKGESYFLLWKVQGAVQEVVMIKVAGMLYAASVATPFSATNLKTLVTQYLNDGTNEYIIAVDGVNRPQKIMWNGTTLTCANFAPTGYGWGTNPLSAVAFWRGRLWLSGNPSSPITLYASMPGSYENFTIGSTGESDAVSVGLSTTPGKIQWLEPMENLHVGTQDAENLYAPSVQGFVNPATTAGQVTYTKQSNVGSTSNLSAAIPDGPVHIVGDDIRAILYSQERGFFDSVTLTDQTEITGPFVQMAVMGSPSPVLFVVAESGKIYRCAVNLQRQLLAWTEWETAGQFLSVCAIKQGTVQELYFLVKRGSKTFVERLRHEATEQKYSACVDCAKGLQLTGANALDMSHLAGSTVQIMADGGQENDQVASASMTVPPAAGNYPYMIAGLGFDSIMETPPIKVVNQEGTSLGRSVKVESITVAVDRAMGMQIGTVDYGIEPAQGRQWTDLLDQAPAWVSGEVTKAPNTGYKSTGVAIRNTGPLPWEVLALAVNVEVGDM